MGKSDFRIGLALGAGAARGLSHVGVLQVLESRGVDIHCIAGTSMGAMVGAVYLLQGGVEKMMEHMRKVFDGEGFKSAHFDSLKELREEEETGLFTSMALMIRRGYKYSLSLTRQSIIEKEVFEKIIEELVPDISIEELPKPFAAISLDAVSGEEVIWTRGSLRHALWSSSAIPGFFPPLVLNGQVLVDGGWINPVPVEPCRNLGADKVIAVDISREIEEIMDYKRGISLILRCAVLTSKHLREHQIKHADLVIRPDVGHIHWADFQNPDDLVQLGKDAALLSLPELASLVGKVAQSGPRAFGDRLISMIGARLKN